MPRCQDFASFCRQLPGDQADPSPEGSLASLTPFSIYSKKKNPSIQNLNETTVKYALFTFGIVWDIDVGMNNIVKAACSTVKSAFDVLMRSSTVTKSPRIKAHTAEHFTANTGMNDS